MFRKKDAYTDIDETDEIEPGNNIHLFREIAPEMVLEMDVGEEPNEAVVRTMLDINKQTLKERGRLRQILHLKKGDVWYIIFTENGDQEKKDKFWASVLNLISEGVEAMILFSDVTQTDMVTKRKTDILTMHYLDNKGTIIVKEIEYTKKFLKGIILGEETDGDPSALYYYLEPIAEAYGKNK
jgi:hypothetical protein